MDSLTLIGQLVFSVSQISLVKAYFKRFSLGLSTNAEVSLNNYLYCSKYSHILQVKPLFLLLRNVQSFSRINLLTDYFPPNCSLFEMLKIRIIPLNLTLQGQLNPWHP